MLTDAARTGIRAGAILGIAVVALFVIVNVLLLGETPGWTYGDDVIVLWDKLLLVAIAVVAHRSVAYFSLNETRLLAAILVVAAALASIMDDIAGGDTSFAQGYVGFMYLLAVLAVPYRPLHTLGLGLVFGATLYGAVEALPAVFSAPPVVHVNAHYVYLASITVLLAGMSGSLYAMRFAQYRERRKAEELRDQVAALEVAKSRFFVNLSHEFRTPLTLIRAPLDDMLAGRYGEVGTRLRRRLLDMREQARNVSNLIDELLDLSKFPVVPMPLHAQEYDLSVLVMRHAQVFQSAMERKEITLRVDVPPEPLQVWYDWEKIERVLTNLLSNALKYTPEKGTIRVRLRREDNGRSEAVLSVKDSGEGIDPKVISMVFDPFVAEGTTRDGQASTGIGLAHVREIITRHGGSINVTSEPGLGADFIVRLPLGRAHLAPEDVVTGAQRDAWSGNGAPALPEKAYLVDDFELDSDPPDHPPDTPLVMIVDDNEAVRTYLHDLLATRYIVEEAADAEEGFARIQDVIPALVVSDVMMPGGGGFELCRRIRNDQRLATIPILLLTARAEDEARQEGIASGADAYLTKPFSSDELLLLAENLIEVRRLLRERVKMPKWMPTAAPTIPSREAEFLERVQRVVAEHLHDADFGVEWLADEVGLSARQLQRRLKEAAQLTAAAFIKAMRMERAAELLAKSDLQVQEVADAVGYRDVSHFSKLFRQVHRVPPSDYKGSVADKQDM